MQKVLFTYWHNHILPNFIKACVITWKRYNPDFEVKIYNDTIFKQEFSTISPYYGTLVCQHKADYIRLRLLEKHGGIWLDISVIMFDSLSKLYDTIHHVTGFDVPSKSLCMENWFIAAPKNNELIRSWRSEFERAITIDTNKRDSYF